MLCSFWKSPGFLSYFVWPIGSSSAQNWLKDESITVTLVAVADHLKTLVEWTSLREPMQTLPNDCLERRSDEPSPITGGKGAPSQVP